MAHFSYPRHNFIMAYPEFSNTKYGFFRALDADEREVAAIYYIGSNTVFITHTEGFGRDLIFISKIEQQGQYFFTYQYMTPRGIINGFLLIDEETADDNLF